MKTLVVGNGVVGTVYGWALAESGVEVTHYVRRGRSAKLADGVELDVLDERQGHPRKTRAHYSMRTTEAVSPDDGHELVIVPVNAFQVEEAVRELVPRVAAGAVFLVLSSNWEGAAGLEAVLTRNRCLLGYADAGGTVRDGLYWTNLGAEVHLGCLDDSGRPALERVTRLFEAADMCPDLPESIVHWLWVHNASVVGFAVPFERVGDFRLLLEDRRELTRSLQATRELLRLCKARGVRVGDFPDVSYLRWMPSWIVIPLMRRLYRKNESMQRYTAHAASPGALKEARLHYGAMLQTADALGVAVPTLRGLAVAPTA